MNNQNEFFRYLEIHGWIKTDINYTIKEIDQEQIEKIDSKKIVRGLFVKENSNPVKGEDIVFYFNRSLFKRLKTPYLKPFYKNFDKDELIWDVFVYRDDRNYVAHCTQDGLIELLDSMKISPNKDLALKNIKEYENKIANLKEQYELY